MINLRTSPVEWSTLLYEIEDAKSHLEALIADMEKGEIDEVDYQIQLGHIFAHLNRAWNSRNMADGYRDEDREKVSSYPEDLQPCG